MNEIWKRKKEVEIKILFLSDGRKVSFLDVRYSEGIPVFYFHVSPESRFGTLFLEESAIRNKLRILAPDRPGFGDSDFKKKYTLLDYKQDIIEIANKLELSKFGTIGVSGGRTTVHIMEFDFNLMSR